MPKIPKSLEGFFNGNGLDGVVLSLEEVVSVLLSSAVTVVGGLVGSPGTLVGTIFETPCGGADGILTTLCEMLFALPTNPWAWFWTVPMLIPEFWGFCVVSAMKRIIF